MARLVSWLLNGIYLTLIFIASPWIIWSACRNGKYREGFGEKLLGLVPRREGNRPCVWLHAVSVGEVNLLATMLAELERRTPELESVISTTTKAGYDLACRKYADSTVFYCPLDLSWAVRTAMHRVRPDLLVLVELELWPNFIQAAKKYGASIAIVNGRLGDKSFRRYRQFKRLVGPVLHKLDVIAVQNQEIMERFVQCGANATTVHTTGSLKFDGAQTDRQNEKTQELRKLANFQDDDIVFLAGSTQEPEEKYALEIFQELAAKHPRLRLILVPRHPQRFAEVAHLLDTAGVGWQRRSELPPVMHSSAASTETGHEAIATKHNSRDSTSRRNVRILLVDTIGELGAWWGTATIGFVGGTFGSRGGQNMLEPAAYGVATCFGPNTWNFRDIVAQLLAADAAKVVKDRDELARFVGESIEKPELAQQLGLRARNLVLSQQGATQRTVELLLPLIEASTKSAARRAA